MALHDGRSPLGVQPKDVPTVMTQKTYPYTAWRLLPSFRPTQVAIKGQYPNHPYWLVTDTGRILGVSEVFDTRADAIAAGRAKLEVMSVKQADLDALKASWNRLHQARNSGESPAA